MERLNVCAQHIGLEPRRQGPRGLQATAQSLDFRAQRLDASAQTPQAKVTVFRAYSPKPEGHTPDPQTEGGRRTSEHGS